MAKRKKRNIQVAVFNIGDIKPIAKPVAPVATCAVTPDKMTQEEFEGYRKAGLVPKGMTIEGYKELLVERRRKAHATALKAKRRNDQGQRVLIKNLKKRRRKLIKLLESINSHWEIEDVVYRLYHSSYKTIWAWDVTQKVMKELEGLYRYGYRNRNSVIKEIMEEGLDKKADPRRWIEAMLHARYLLEMAIKYSKEVKKPLQCLPSGYAAILYLYGLR